MKTKEMCGQQMQLSLAWFLLFGIFHPKQHQLRCRGGKGCRRDPMSLSKPDLVKPLWNPGRLFSNPPTPQNPGVLQYCCVQTKGILSCLRLSRRTFCTLPLCILIAQWCRSDNICYTYYTFIHAEQACAWRTVWFHHYFVSFYNLMMVLQKLWWG